MRQTSANERRSEPATQDVQIEPISTAGPGIPGMQATMGFATEVFATWMAGLMAMPLELAPAIGCSAMQAINGEGFGGSSSSRQSTPTR